MNNCENKKCAKNEYYWKWFFRILTIASFLMLCVLVYYVWKLWDIWRVVERAPKP